MSTDNCPRPDEITVSTGTLVRFADARPYPATDQVHVGRVRLWGHPVWLVYRRDEHEWTRRERHGVGAVEDLGTLALLMDLPAGLPVPSGELHPADQRLLRRLPAGVLRHDTGMVVRDLISVLTPLMAIVPARTWDDGADTASRFAVYCARLVLLPEPPADPLLVLSDASLYGIGVTVAGTTGPARVLVESTVATDMRCTPAGWAFSEQIYTQVRGQQRQQAAA